MEGRDRSMPALSSPKGRFGARFCAVLRAFSTPQNKLNPTRDNTYRKLSSPNIFFPRPPARNLSSRFQTAARVIRPNPLAARRPHPRIDS